ncbi:hypothetical protein [Halomarina pelagica]|uniref:hypothetical protein n=1 Tax=Halomarina pelagica TaxID=2961599 RepID=UPI0020C32928|nr:hypothetical protein [Halomarina sp. BND7]
MQRNYFEDCVVGETFEFGDCMASKDDIIAFARQFDPQPFHVDEAEAEESQPLINSAC